METFTFDTPALFGVSTGYWQKRLLCWLRDRLAPRGVDAFGPVVDAAGWLLAINAEDGLVTLRLAHAPGGRTAVTIAKFGEAEGEYEDTVVACEDALGIGRALTPFKSDFSARAG